MGPPAVEVEHGPEGVLAYIADMLAELADMAAQARDPGLETAIRIAALKAERARRQAAAA